MHALQCQSLTFSFRSNLQDHRGKTIVSAACNMVDHVDSMFHYFKRNLGYNIYKRFVLPACLLACATVCVSDGLTRLTLTPLFLTYIVNGRLDQALAAQQGKDDGSATGGQGQGAAGAAGSSSLLQSPATRNTRSSRRLRGNEDEPLFLEVRQSSACSRLLTACLIRF